MVTVISEAPRSGHAGVQTLKTVKCLWRTVCGMEYQYLCCNMLLHQVFSLFTCRAAGGELQTVLDTEEGLQEQYAARFMRQILEGLSSLHSNNIAHLDLKVRKELVVVVVVVVVVIILLLLFDMDISCHRPFLPGTFIEPAVIPTAQASSFTLRYFPYYV